MQGNTNIVEVFSSIQGEGLYVGCRQIFVRMAGCNLKCLYCDTPASQEFTTHAQIEIAPGMRQFISVQNPVTGSMLAQRINQLLASPHHSISFTGGEPLCQWQVIAEIAPMLQGKLYLETNGTLYRELEHILPYVDIISMDIKLPSAGKCAYWTEHRKFLEIAAAKEVFVKMVITADTTDDEFFQAIRLVQEVGDHIPVILQPVSPNKHCRAVAPETMLMLQERALQRISDVRVIPQTHKFMGQL